MPTFLQSLTILMAAISGILAVPAPHNGADIQSTSFFLRANCPHKPWHMRHIVALPTSHQLGLENFTVHPMTPALSFHPILLTNGNYALQGDGDCDDPDESLYLAALQSKEGTHTASMAMICSSSPSHVVISGDSDVCSMGYDCIADQWTFDSPGPDMVHHKFRFAGFEGDWEPFKDAGKAGWHVYWKGNAGLDHPIDLDLVPMGL